MNSMEGLYGKNENLVKLAIKSGYSPITVQNEISIFDNGEELFNNIINDLKLAEKQYTWNILFGEAINSEKNKRYSNKESEGRSRSQINI